VTALARRGAAPLGAGRGNNFDAIRLCAALAVLVGHAWPLTGREGAPAIGTIPVYTLGVYVFFSMSGYLISRSWAEDSRPFAFLARRCARIFPALVVTVVASALLIGPLVSSLKVHEYFASSETYGYLTNVFLVANYSLPGVFTDNPTSAVNGSLWTIGPEFLCYLAVLAVGVVAWSMRRLARESLVAVALLGGSAIIVFVVLHAVDTGDLRATFRAAVFFLGGACLARLGWTPPPVAVALLTGLVAGVALIAPSATLYVVWPALPVIVVGVGAMSWPGVRAVGRVGDLSYGTYLWGFPVQQVVTATWPGMPLPANVCVVVAVTLCIAFASWWLLERRVLRSVRARVARRPRALA
jgi:peptidoglycan/LPS O-acetylase OafA/YrhL